MTPLQKVESFDAIDSSDALKLLPLGMLGTACAGGVFGTLIAVVFICTEVSFGFFGFLSSIFILTLCTVLGLIFAALVSLPTSILFALFHWSLGSPFGIRLAHSLIGSGSGFFATSWFTGGTIPTSWWQAPTLEFRHVLQIGATALAMILGHLGAVWPLRRAGGEFQSLNSQYINTQLQIRHIMVFTAWAAVFSWLAATSERDLSLWVAALVFQIIIAYCDYWRSRAFRPGTAPK